MTESRPDDLIAHIRQAAADSQSFVRDMTREQFESDKRSQQAVIYSLLIVGEAATKIMGRYPDFVENNSHIPWRNMRGMRNRFAHGYFDINLNVVWDTVHEAIPDLLQKLDLHS